MINQHTTMLEELQKLNIFLVGMMGCGKSTVGQLLAAQIGYQFFDTDHLVEQVSQQSISSIFEMAGEEEFRAIESKVLGEISAYTKLVIATGGGIVMRQENWGYLRQGLVVWIDVPAEILWQRIASVHAVSPQENRSRPLMNTPEPQATLTQILDSRHHRYAAADLHISVTADQAPASVAAQILEKIPSVLKSKTASP
jgi:shikimate kinase